MMARGDSKLLLMLAASDFSNSELKSFLRTIDKFGSSATMRKIETLREIAADEKPVTNRSNLVQFRDNEQREIIDRIEALLVGEAGLPRTTASRILHSELTKEVGEKYYIPAHNKIAFRLWLARLLDQVPPSSVLHVASRLRNNIVHGKQSLSDWPLDDTE